MAWDDYDPVEDDEERRRGAPADFPGVVLPNPQGIKPMADTDAPPPPDHPSAQFSTDNYHGHRSGYTGNATQLWPDVQMREVSNSYPAVKPPEETAVHPLAVPAVGGTDELENRVAQPKEAISAHTEPSAQRPQWKDYAPAEPTTTAGKVGRFFGNMLYPYRKYEEGKENTAKENYKNAVSEYEAPGKEAEQAATTEQKESQAGLEKAQAKALENPSDWKGQPGILNDQGQPLELNEKTGQYRWGNVGGAKPLKTPTETAAQHEQDMEKIGSKIGFSGDPKRIQPEINAAVQAGKITPQEASDYISYRMIKGDQGTKVTVPVEVHAGEESTDLDKQFSGKEVVANMPDGKGGFVRRQMPYGEAKRQGIHPDEMTILSSKEAQENRDKFASIATTMDTVKRYRNDFKTANLTKEDRAALGVLTSHQDKIADSFLGVTMSGVIDTLIGKPLTGYSEKLMGSWMTQDQYEKLSKPAKRMMADYVSTILENFNNIKSTMGSVPRNPQIIAMEVKRVPLPFLDFDSASPAFDNFRDGIKDRARSLPEVQ